MKVIDVDGSFVGIFRKSDRVFIPIEPTNIDYAKYLAWAEDNLVLEYDAALITAPDWE